MDQEIYVWDRFVRIFHWSLVLLFLIGYITGEEGDWLHVYSGYTIAVLISMRVLWGFIGSTHARFKDFIYSPSVIIEYTRSMVGRNPKHYLGHNPLGGLMVIALLASIFVITLSGLKLYAVEEGKGPLAGETSVMIIGQAHADSDGSGEFDDDHHGDDEEEDYWEDIHEASVNFTILLIILHIVGVFVESRLHDESLVKAMITGRKDSA